jgi:hypothetical protein
MDLEDRIKNFNKTNGKITRKLRRNTSKDIQVTLETLRAKHLLMCESEM